MSQDPAVIRETIELEIEPIPPDTIASAKEELMPLIEAALREAGQAELLTTGQIQIQVERTFPTDQAIVIGLTLLSQIAIETFKGLVLPALKRKFKARKRTRAKRHAKKRR